MSVGEEAPRAVRLPRPQRRAQLLDVALEVFVGQGYHSAGMDEIAERAGISKPVLYQHFPSKLDLYLALLDLGAQALVDRVSIALTSTRDNRQRVSAAVEAYFAFVDDPSGAYRILFESDLFNDKLVRERVERSDQECAELLVAVIAEDTGLDTEKSTTLAYGLIGMAKTSARRWLRSKKALPRDEAARMVSRMAWRGISGFPRSHSPEFPTELSGTIADLRSRAT